MDTGIFIGDKIITTSWDKIWDKPNTLSGYGITDAYTKSDADGKYVLKAGDTVTGDLSVAGQLFAGNEQFVATLLYTFIGRDKGIYFSNDANNGSLYVNTHYDRSHQAGSFIINEANGVVTFQNNPTVESNTILHTGNYAGELDNRYVNKAGDTMTGKLLFNADSGIDLISIPRTKSAISFNNTGSNRIGINFTDGDGNLRIAKTDINQDWVSGDVNILLGSNNYKVWHAGNDGSGSGLDADLLDGKHLHQGQWDSICYIGGAGVLEIGKYIDFHEEQGMSNDFSCRIMSQGDYQNTLHLPTSSGTLATLGDNVASATRLATSRSIYGNPFDGTSDIPVTAIGKMRFLYFTKDDGSELGYVGKGSDHANNLEFINYEGSLILGANKSDDVIITTNHNVGIGTTNAAHKLHVEGDIYATNGFSETSDIRKKKVLSPHTVDLDDMAYADLFNYTLIDDEKEIVRVGTNAHYWLDKLPQVVTKDSDEYLSLNYGVLGTVCALSVSKYVKQLEDRVTLLENKIASLQ